MLCKNHVDSTHRLLKGLSLATLVATLVACGGGGGSSDKNNTNASPSSVAAWQPGKFESYSTFANKCALPRSGINPFTGVAYGDTQGSFIDENNFLRSWSNHTYLWYNEIHDRNPAEYSNTQTYFDLLKTSASSPTGRPKDNFHFTYKSDEWERLSESGITYSYGMEFAFISTVPPRSLIVAYTQPNSPATLLAQPVLRGARIVKIDEVDFVNTNVQADIDTINDALFPSAQGQVHTFEIQDAGASTTRKVVLQSASVTSVPVQNVKTIDTATGKVGYLTFNDHIATAERGLVDAISQLDAAGVTDLVVDVRYNGGGYVDIASELAYMIAGYATEGKIFETMQFNDKHPTKNPITGETLTPVPFHRVAQGFSVSAGQALPSLDLKRVFLLTSGNTCSASESLINSLRGVGVEVIQIGRQTCGKPYGFYPQPNCGTTYFSVQFRGANAAGFGDYSDGFIPSNSDDGKTHVKGCTIDDDFTRALGDVNETGLAKALAYRTTASCNASLAGVMQKTSSPLRSVNAVIVKNPGLQNKLLRN